MAVTTSGLPVHEIDSDTYDRIVEAGLLDGQRVELIDGVITDMSPQSPEHAFIVALLTEYLASFGRRLRVQLPLSVSTSNTLPEPDVAVVATPPSATAHPSDAAFVAEVATTLRDLDLSRKAQLYAASSIAVYWVVDTGDRAVHVHTHPVAGRYETVEAYAEDATLPPPLHDLPPLAVADLFPGS